jgi:hypothetical protein
VDLAQLLVLDVIKWQSPNQLSTNFRHQRAKLLTNLTFGSTDCKKLLCLEENFVTSVCQLLTIPTLVRVCLVLKIVYKLVFRTIVT